MKKQINLLMSEEEKEKLYTLVEKEGSKSMNVYLTNFLDKLCIENKLGLELEKAKKENKKENKEGI